jgi:putative flippase GtrA
MNEESGRNNLTLFYYYVIFASIATLVDLSLLYSLTELGNMWYFHSAIIGYSAGMIVNYVLNKYFNFKNYSKRIVSQFGIFTAVAMVGLGLNQLIIYLLVEFADVWYMAAKIIAIGIVMFWSFFGHKQLTFKYE